MRLLTVNQARFTSLRVRLPVPPLPCKLMDRRKDYESFSVGSTPIRATMFKKLDCGCIEGTLVQRNITSEYSVPTVIVKLCSKHLAEAELDQQGPPKLQVGSSNLPCESNVPSPNGDGSRLMSGPNEGSSPSGTISASSSVS